MAKEKEQITPMMKQFRDIKAQYPDAMLLFRCGDFYETYCEDAVRASKILTSHSPTAATAPAGSIRHKRWRAFLFMPSTPICPNLCVRVCVWRYATSWRTPN